MTLIASTRNYGIPFLFSDILFYSKDGESDLVIPTNTQKVSEYLNPIIPYKPAALFQKMYIIADNVCLLMAGKEYLMRSFLEDFTIICKVHERTGISKESIKAFLESQQLTLNYPELSLFISHVTRYDNDHGYCSEFSYGNWLKQENQEFQTIYASGTGAQSCLFHAGIPLNVESSHERGSIYRAVQSNMNFVARLLTIERTNSTTLEEAWGAGYEIAYYNGWQFEKFNNIAYIIWKSYYDSDGNIKWPIPQIILHYQYIESILHITAIEPNTANLKDNYLLFVITSDDFSINTFPVCPLNVSLSVEGTAVSPHNSFQTHLISQGFSIGADNGKAYIPSLFTDGPEVRLTLQEGKRFELIIHRECMNKLAEHAKILYKTRVID